MPRHCRLLPSLDPGPHGLTCESGDLLAIGLTTDGCSILISLDDVEKAEELARVAMPTGILTPIEARTLAARLLAAAARAAETRRTLDT